MDRADGRDAPSGPRRVVRAGALWWGCEPDMGRRGPSRRPKVIGLGPRALRSCWWDDVESALARSSDDPSPAACWWAPRVEAATPCGQVPRCHRNRRCPAAVTEGDASSGWSERQDDRGMWTDARSVLPQTG